MEAPMSKKSFSARVRGIILASNRQPTRVENYRTTLMNLDDYLPQAEEDRKIALKVNQLQGLIEAHATSNYYHNRPVNQEKEEILDLLQKRLFKSDEAATRRLAYNLHGTSQRGTSIRIMIARAIVAAIFPYGDAETSLLPQEIVLFMNAFKNNPRFDETAQVDEVALCEWRRLGFYLLSSSQSKTVQLQHTGFRIERMLSSLDEILSPFADSDQSGIGSGRRLNNLRAIIQKATDIGVLLFGQPCGWDLDWTLRPTNDEQELVESPNSNHPMPQLSQQTSNAAQGRTQTSLSDGQTQIPQQEKKKRRRLGRSHSVRTKDIPREEMRRDRHPPTTPLRLPVQRPSEVMVSEEGALFRTITGGTENQNTTKQHGHSPQLHSHQSHDRPSMEQERTRSYAQRSKSEPEFARIHQQETMHHRNAYDVSNNQRVTKTSDSYSFQEDMEEITPSPKSKDNYVNGVQQQLVARTRQTGSYGLILDGPEQSRFERESQTMVDPRKPSRPIICFPALLKVRDEYGCQLPEPLLVLEPVVDKSFLTAWY
ncbi:hypothetical protein EG329_010572 [Mollisiaceae sp. DMI_Dod_QoI]|nr:hypothetical protein EG329_010572 [Helotiales sp. DMI_Dod_QoI]